jgi:hypothetical protein
MLIIVRRHLTNWHKDTPERTWMPYNGFINPETNEPPTKIQELDS